MEDVNGKRIDPEVLLKNAEAATASLQTTALTMSEHCRAVAKSLREMSLEMEARADEIANTSVSVFDSLAKEAMARATQGMLLLKDLQRHHDAINAPVPLEETSSTIPTSALNNLEQALLR